MTQPESVVAAARGWLGTRFHHQGRLKKSAAHKGGVDCLGLLAGVAGELQLASRSGEMLSRFDETDYPHYPDGSRLQATLASLLYPIEVSKIAPGDVLLLRIDGNPQHLAIVSDIGIIHAYAPARSVVEHRLDAWWQQRIVAAYRLPEIFK